MAVTMQSETVRMRSALPADVSAILALIQPYAEAGLVLPRTAADLRRRLPNFLVAEREGSVVGCVALRDFGGGLEEVRTLAVDASCQGHGIGTMLVRAVTQRARERSASRLFALTVRPSLFVHLNFTVVPKSRFPGKVWLDCRRCAKREDCDETAVVLYLDDAPDGGTATS